MAKVVDITEKLDFSGNPMLRIKDEEIEVNADAGTVLKIMGIAGNGEGTTPEDVIEMYGLLFNESERKKIDKFKLSVNGLKTVIEEAVLLVTGEEAAAGE